MSKGKSESEQGARLFRVNVFIEGSAGEVEALTEVFEKAICDVDHNEPNARCPHRWFIMTEIMEAEEAATWDELLNE
jgi:hypothetical protein